MPDKCKNRERIASAGTADVPFIPLGAIRGNQCFRCFGPSDNILKCSACKRAGYCSKQCQKLDWSITHKNHCKIFKTINEVEEQQYQRTRTWAEYREYIVSEIPASGVVDSRGEGADDIRIADNSSRYPKCRSK
jgi:splicing suppressor protein 51